MMKGVDEKINESVPRWFGHIERMGNDRIAKKVCVGNCLEGQPQKRWIDSVNECL